MDFWDSRRTCLNRRAGLERLPNRHPGLTVRSLRPRLAAPLKQQRSGVEARDGVRGQALPTSQLGVPMGGRARGACGLAGAPSVFQPSFRSPTRLEAGWAH